MTSRYLPALVSLLMVASANETGDSWNETGRALGLLVRNCWANGKNSGQEDVTALLSCLQKRTLLALRRSMQLDVIPLMEGVQLVRFQERMPSSSHNVSEAKTNVSFTEWQSQMIDTLSNVFETHVIRISMNDTIGEMSGHARRRRRHHFMPLMVFGMVGLGMILIPMGFQFLTVLGGKALLLAKMALILSSIQGLKKVATSNVHYGLYHAAPSNPWYDRRAEDSGDYYKYIPEQPPYPNYYQRV